MECKFRGDELKLSKVEFTVRYEDGETKDVEEGVLFEVDPEDGRIIFHNGTSRPSVLFTAVVAMHEAINRFGMDDYFDRWFEKNYGGKDNG